MFAAPYLRDAIRLAGDGVGSGFFETGPSDLGMGLSVCATFGAVATMVGEVWQRALEVVQRAGEGFQRASGCVQRGREVVL
jgi:hypothetical protein